MAERERIRILNKTPVIIINPRQIAKRERAAKRKLMKNPVEDNLPAWFINPLNEVDEEALERQEAERVALEQEKLAQEAKSEAEK